ncbi:chromosome condensation complex protein [Reticulomyxa filosa]|uniref:Chromosome condensation complex protein n=1 Tax=Reticulomyxa filosa TaxID=46433 RepID=X6NJN6_RETFI|nr:chromosome condensation complex protein [Reticulomyxa filosa]|eukprot:ETO26133.1 chromosome condensation complex protein [Reticulomyxa filosa]
MAQLLSSRTQSDVLECVEFFKVACVFKIANEHIGFKKMLPLVWNKDNPAIVNAVIGAYHYKYIYNGVTQAENEVEQARQALSIAAKLVKLTNNATLADITCIEELIRLLVVTKKEEKMANIDIPAPVFAALWGIFEGKLQDVTTAQRRGALDLLRMAAVANRDILSVKIERVVEIGFGDIAEVTQTKIKGLKKKTKKKIISFGFILTG